MKKINLENSIFIFISVAIIPLIVWIKYSIGEPQAIWFVNLLFGLK